MLPGTVLTEADAIAEQQPDDTVVVRTIVPGTYFAEPLVHRTLRAKPGVSRERTDARNDELLYVMSGSGDIVIGAERISVAPTDAVQVQAGEAWRIEVAEGDLHLLSFLVPAPVTPWAASLAKPVDRLVHIAQLGAQLAQAATGDRMFEVLFNRERGSRGATMFIGFIPTSGAPTHYHLYDEICVIVRGTGALHSRGVVQPLSPGAAFHVAPRFLHALENPNPEDLWVLGVFRPEGSAAAAFYPDGTPAPTNED